MASSSLIKQIPEIPVITVLQTPDEFLVKRPDANIPNKVKWDTMLSIALSAIPDSYYG